MNMDEILSRIDASRDPRTITIYGFQKRVAVWVLSTFGEAVLGNGRERALRLVEEAVEFAQSIGVAEDRLHTLVSYVFARPAGDPRQELAGTMVTLCAAAASVGVDLDSAAFDELRRIEQPEIVAKCRRRQEEKRAASQTDEGEGRSP